MDKDIKEIKNQQELEQFDFTKIHYNNHNIFNYYLQEAMPHFLGNISEYLGFECTDSEVHYLGYSQSEEIFLLGFYVADVDEVSHGGFWAFSIQETIVSKALHFELADSFYTKKVKNKARENYPDLMDIIQD